MTRARLSPKWEKGAATNLAHGLELAAMLAAARHCPNDGASIVQLYERDLATVFAGSEAVAVSSNSATVTVLCGALGLERGSTVLISGSAARPWVLGGLGQAGVRPFFVAESELDGVEGDYHAILFAVDATTEAGLARARNAAVRLGCPLALDLTAHSNDPIVARRFARLADLCFFDTGGAKRFSTGEGGVLLTRDATLAERARTYARFGGLDGIRTGVNHKLSAIQAALGRVRLRAICPEAELGPPGAAPATARTRTAAGDPIPDRFDPTSPGDEAQLAEALAEGLDGSGPAVRKYERALATTFAAPHALAVSSGFAAILVALAALGLEVGDEVLLTPTCPLCTVFALTAMGLVPVFCDTRADSFSVDLARARERIGPRTRAIIEIPMWGYPVPAHEVADFARARGLFFVLDLALSHGTELFGRDLWHYAEIAAFSTHATKMLVTGEGGFVLTHRADLAEAVARARHYGERLEGLNYRLAGAQAALGTARLPALADHVRRRRALMQEISAALNNPHVEPFPIVAGGTPGGSKLLVRERSGRGGALNAHLARAGVPSDIRIYNCRPLYEFPVFEDRAADCPNAAALLRAIATLPVHPDIGRLERDRIIQALNSYDPEAL